AASGRIFVGRIDSWGKVGSSPRRRATIPMALSRGVGVGSQERKGALLHNGTSATELQTVRLIAGLGRQSGTRRGGRKHTSKLAGTPSGDLGVFARFRTSVLLHRARKEAGDQRELGVQLRIKCSFSSRPAGRSVARGRNRMGNEPRHAV